MNRLSLLFLIASAPVAGQPPVAPPPAAITTTAPLDAVQRCLSAHLAETGKATPINTAAGVMLDLAFQNVAADGKVATSHITFAIEDLGTQRRITATAADGADATLARQMLRDVTKGCTEEPAG